MLESTIPGGLDVSAISDAHLMVQRREIARDLADCNVDMGEEDAIEALFQMEEDIIGAVDYDFPETSEALLRSIALCAISNHLEKAMDPVEKAMDPEDD